MQLPPSFTVFDLAQIERAIDEVAAGINDRCDDDEWIVMCVMNGGLMFTAEIMKRISFPSRLDAVRVSRYHESTRGDDLVWHTRPSSRLSGSRVLLLDDIFDEGHTLVALKDYFEGQDVDDLFSAVLVEKEHDRKVHDYRPDLIGLRCADAYVFGFGMDYRGLYRSLPEIRQLDGD